MAFVADFGLPFAIGPTRLLAFLQRKGFFCPARRRIDHPQPRQGYAQIVPRSRILRVGAYRFTGKRNRFGGVNSRLRRSAQVGRPRNPESGRVVPIGDHQVPAGEGVLGLVVKQLLADLNGLAIEVRRFVQLSGNF